MSDLKTFASTNIKVHKNVCFLNHYFTINDIKVL